MDTFKMCTKCSLSTVLENSNFKGIKQEKSSLKSHPMTKHCEENIDVQMTPMFFYISVSKFLPDLEVEM